MIKIIEMSANNFTKLDYRQILRICWIFYDAFSGNTASSVYEVSFHLSCLSYFVE